MENLEEAATIIKDAAENLPNELLHFDLEKENFGVFTNLTLLTMILVSLTRNRTLFEHQKKFKRTYDYIIVGAGTAGSVLANRLTEKPCVSVLVLEAGDEQPILTDVPAFARVFYKTQIDWQHTTTPQKYGAFGQKEHRVTLNNGKVIGGSSILNAMQAVRGNKDNFNQWAKEGATGWSYDDVLPYFLKLEDNRNIKELDEGYHSTGGPMTMEKVNYNPELKEPIIKAVEDLGYKVVDSNGKQQTGILDFQMTARNQQRCSTAKAYLNPARGRPNLDVITKAYARKVLISTNKRAYGVEFDHEGKTHRVRARKEVILATGAIKTPQLLLLSGIGPREELEKHNIRVVHDLPGVGKNLMDHFASSLVYSADITKPNVVVNDVNPLHVLEYINHRRGPLCSPTQIFLINFLNGVNNTKGSIDFPEQQVFFAEYYALDAKLNMNLNDEVYDQVFKPYEHKPLYICFSAILQPYSRGEITLNSTDPYDRPLIDTRYYEDQRDLRTIVEGLKVCNAVARHSALKKLKVEPLKTVFPGCKKDVGDEDKYLTCVAQQLINTFWHYSGTARMGSPDDPRSVVDPQLRVIGVSHLRVVNAAVFPIVTSGNTNLPTMMVAEKASDIIKESIHCKNSKE